METRVPVFGYLGLKLHRGGHAALFCNGNRAEDVGALGGLATVWVMRSLFSPGYSQKVIPCAVIWSFSLSLCAEI
jgi:hypothetical protein